MLKYIFYTLLIYFSYIPLAYGCDRSHAAWTAEPEDDCQAGHLWITSVAFKLIEHNIDCLPIINESIGPDLYENNFWTFSGHFYDPDTGYNWLGIGNTALENFMYHMDRAIDPINSDWQKSLAWSLHYLQDACVPHHAANLTYINSYHGQFERFARSIQSQFSPPAYATYGADFEVLLHDCAVIAKPYAMLIEQNLRWHEAAEITMKEAQKRTAFTINKVFKMRGIE